MDAATWYYVDSGRERRGPMTENQMRVAIAAGTVGAATLVWNAAAGGDWQPAELSTLAPFLQPGGAPIADPAVGFAGMDPGPGPVPVSGLTDAVSRCLNKYAVFAGRASRAEFWYFILAYWLAHGVLWCIGGIVLGDDQPLNRIFWLAMLCPLLAVTARRLHDTDRSGWWAAIYAVPLLGVIVLAVFGSQRGTPGPNRFG